MNELSVHPNVYATGHSKGLLTMLEALWLREQPAGDGTMYDEFRAIADVR